MFFTGFADEAGKPFADQIEATRRLGWKFIECRAIGTGTLSTISEAEFEAMLGMLNASGIAVNCFGSGIANWGKSPRSEEDFQASRKELLDALPRMKKLGTKLLRGMSFKLLPGEVFDSPELEAIIFRKVNELVKICEDNGIVYGHENCMNYAGQSHIHTLRLLDNVKSKALTLIYDTGNPVFTFRRLGAEPYPLQSSWEFYSKVREFVGYIHIKDGVPEYLEDGTVKPHFCFAGDGCGDVRAIVIDLLKRGYDGGFSMEPHIATVFHADDNPEDSDVQRKRKLETYVEYGKRFEKLLAECRAEANGNA